MLDKIDKYNITPNLSMFEFLLEKREIRQSDVHSG